MTPTRAIAYRRVSTDEQAASGLGLDAQAAAVEAECDRRGWELVSVATDAGVSGSVAVIERPQLAAALAAVATGEADVLVVAKLDRLTRSLMDLTALMEQARREDWALVALDVDVDTTTATGALVANLMGAVNEWERRIIGERTRSALAAKKAQGHRLGRPVTLADDVRHRIAAERAEGRSLRTIAATLTTEGVPTAKGGAWHASTVRAVLASLDLDREAATTTVG